MVWSLALFFRQAIPTQMKPIIEYGKWLSIAVWSIHDVVYQMNHSSFYLLKDTAPTISQSVNVYTKDGG